MPNILIVDDEFESRNAVIDYLTTSSIGYYTVHEAVTLEKGELLLKKIKPSILFLEVSLIDGNGMELGQKALEWSPDISIIIMTYLKEFDLVFSSINLGFVGYLLKPFSKTEVHKLTERIHTNSLFTESKVLFHKENKKERHPDLANPIQTALQFIQSSYKEQITLDEVAQSVYLSTSYFSRLFKDEIGVTFVDYLMTYRIDQSKSLLKMTTLPMEVIANQVGFTTGAYFSTAFRKKEGCTPSEYRSLFDPK
ncbi:DNA-binding response regulator [Oceanobacillus oncorhynchi subsp. incaldanensis]|uniref:helix-turn-helix domain-containing protein n=1 Tax=Oceanobacillus oncorhynchi TaxID=545501 RepID=UPI001B241B2F|nr:helix-turn-helix domain-containing protein [Oceanobacillus oncorhynchi]GIO19558.1 DNA-binding response regulator [Oceanobacillus oncorhynchi subsp. incaldanensis]